MRQLSFKEYNMLAEAIDTKTGNYVSVAVKMPRVIEQMRVFSGKITKDPHITLIYSKESTRVDKNSLLNELNKRFKNYGVAEFVKAEMFDSDEPNKACIVMVLHSPLLNKIHNWLKQYGDLKHSYEEYKPHVTLFYDVDKTEAKYWVDWLNKEEFDKFVSFKGFESTNIIEDWNK